MPFGGRHYTKLLTIVHRFSMVTPFGNQTPSWVVFKLCSTSWAVQNHRSGFILWSPMSPRGDQHYERTSSFPGSFSHEEWGVLFKRWYNICSTSFWCCWSRALKLDLIHVALWENLWYDPYMLGKEKLNNMWIKLRICVIFTLLFFQVIQRCDS
jgi:hypothetical protein